MTSHQIDTSELDRVPWTKYGHAYGSALDVPEDIRALTSADAEVRKKALWNLFGSIIHQGSIYSATVPSVPILLRLATDPRLPDRAEVCELLESISQSTRSRHYGDRTAVAVHRAFVTNLDMVRKLASDAETQVREFGSTILEHLDAEEGEVPVRIDGVISTTSVAQEFTCAAWCDFFTTQPGKLHNAPRQRPNPFKPGEIMTIRTDPAAADVLIEGRHVGYMYWSLTEEPLIHVTVDPSAISYVRECASALGGEFRHEQLGHH